MRPYFGDNNFEFSKWKFSFTNRSGTTPRHMVLWSMLFTTFNNDRRGNIVSWELSIKFSFGTAKILFTGAAVVLGKEIQRLSYEPQLHPS